MTTTTAPMAAPMAAPTDEMIALIDEMFAKANHPDTPGAALAVARGGELLLERYYGLADLEHRVPVGPDTMFDIASTSKQFAAAAILLLARRGELSLDDQIQDYVPELGRFERPVTIRHLIHHTSGIRDYFGLQAVRGMRSVDVLNVADVVELLSHQRSLNFAPGEKHLYSNSGYVLMAVIVTRVTGMSFREWTSANILEPAGLSRSFFRDDPFKVIPGLVRGYTFTGGEYKKVAEGLDDIAGDGGLISSVTELVKWDRNYITEAVGGPGFTAAMEEVGTPEGSEENYAFGLSIGNHRGLRTVSHGGALQGFQGQFLRFPDQQLTVVVQANTGGFDSAGIAIKVAELFLADQMEPAADDGSGSEEAGEDDAAPGTPDGDLLGIYQDPESGSAFDIELLEGSLTLSVQDTHIPLRRRGGDRFITEHPVYSLDMEFADVDANLALRVFHGGEVVMTLNRVTPPELSEVERAAFAGSYRSDELDTDFEVRAVGGELHLWRRHAGRDVLRPTGADEFASSFGRVRFVRSQEGSVSGLVADASRAVGTRFERVA